MNIECGVRAAEAGQCQHEAGDQRGADPRPRPRAQAGGGAADCVEAARDTGLVLDTFAAEVARLRALNTGLLGEITTNRDTMQRLAASTARGGRQLRQLETEVSCAEAEAEQLEASLAQLQLVRLPPPLQLHCDNSDDVTNNVTNTSPQHVILSPSTLV